MESAWKPIVIGVLDIISSVAAFVFGVFFIAFSLFEILLPVGTTVRIITAVIVGTPLFILGVLALVGGIFALRRQRWGLVLASSLAASLSFPFLGIPASIFALLSEGVSKAKRIILLIVFVPIWLIILLILAVVSIG